MIKSVIFVYLLLFSSTLNATTKAKAKGFEISSETRLVLKSVSERYRKLKNWSAEFSQETYSLGLGRGTFQKGEFHFSDPNRIYFSVAEPDASTFVSNGQEAWLAKYPKGIKAPADVKHFRDLSRIELDRYLIFLRGIDTLSPEKEANLLKEYKVSSKTNPSEISLVLEPRRSSEVTQVEMVFSQTEVAPKKIILTDALGNTTTVLLVKTLLDVKHAKSAFVPSFPKKSKVVEQ